MREGLQCDLGRHTQLIPGQMRSGLAFFLLPTGSCPLSSVSESKRTIHLQQAPPVSLCFSASHWQGPTSLNFTSPKCRSVGEAGPPLLVGAIVLLSSAKVDGSLPPLHFHLAPLLTSHRGEGLLFGLTENLLTWCWMLVSVSWGRYLPYQLPQG